MLSTFCASASVVIPANDPLIEYTRRIAIKLKDEGTQNFYNVIIDHSPCPKPPAPCF